MAANNRILTRRSSNCSKMSSHSDLPGWKKNKKSRYQAKFTLETTLVPSNVHKEHQYKWDELQLGKKFLKRDEDGNRSNSKRQGRIGNPP